MIDWAGLVDLVELAGLSESCSAFDLDREAAERDVIAALRRGAELEQLVNTPEVLDFLKGVQLEAAHQEERWGQDDRAGKSPADWFWLVGYLAGKALHAAMAGDLEKHLHHCISTAAVLANWHKHTLGKSRMRPGSKGSEL